MVLGAVWCPAAETRTIAERLRALKVAHGLPADFEVKWTKVSPAKIDFYLALVDYCFAEPSLHFRALVVPDKAALDHDSFNQDHDTWYYKMYFDLLKLILDPHARYRIYLDVKDTRSAPKERRLREVLSNNLYDFQREIIERLQAVRSHEVEQIQLTDLLTGIVSYANRELHSSPANAALVAGTQTYSVTAKTAGSATFTSTDITDGAKTANTSPSTTINAGAFSKLQLLVPGETAAPGTGSGKTGSPSARTAGSAFTVTVNTVDANWNPVSSTDTVAITSTSAGATSSAALIPPPPACTRCATSAQPRLCATSTGGAAHAAISRSSAASHSTRSGISQSRWSTRRKLAPEASHRLCQCSGPESP